MLTRSSSPEAAPEAPGAEGCVLLAGAVHATRGLCAWAAVAICQVPGLRLLGWAVARENLGLPYRPGRLAFAVSPAITAALHKLPASLQPHALLVHGHGSAHPRGFGLACHVGRLHSLKTVGVAEKLLVGRHEPVATERGAWQPIWHGAAVVGAALRTRPEAKVLYVSPGWDCELAEAVALVLRATGRYRWPEPLRHARMRLRTALRHRGELHRPACARRLGL